MEKRVYIAAGHGGGDSGAVAQGTTEAAEAIQITNRVVDILRADGQLIVEHVPNELGLQGAINWVNARASRLLSGLSVEIHKNSGGGNGSEVWTPSYPDAESIRQASVIASAIAGATGEPNRGVKQAQNNRFGKLGWTDDTKTYSVLVEAGFIDVNPVGAAANERYARGIANGLLAVWGLSPKPVAPPVVKPPVVSWKYKVVSNVDGKQLGVYNEKSNAWLKYTSVNGAAKILDASSTDITHVFVNEFTPVTPEPTPVTDPRDDEQDKRLSAIEALLNKIVEFLTSIFSGFKK